MMFKKNYFLHIPFKKIFFKKSILMGFTIFLVVIFFAGCQRTSKNVYLSDIEPIKKEGQLYNDKNLENHKLEINGTRFEKGLCVSSDSRVSYALEDNFKEFKAIIGHHVDYPEYKGKVKFIVYLDDKKTYESSWMPYGKEETLSLSVQDKEKLTLQLEDDGNTTAYIVWADAKLIRK